jgi:hypothetical protein
MAPLTAAEAIPQRNLDLPHPYLAKQGHTCLISADTAPFRSP